VNTEEFLPKCIDKVVDVVNGAADEARESKAAHIGTEHLVLSLARHGYLAHADVWITEVRRLVPVGAFEVKGKLPITPRVKAAYDEAVRQCSLRGHSYVALDDLSMALRSDPDSVAGAVFEAVLRKYYKPWGVGCEMSDDNVAAEEARKLKLDGINDWVEKGKP
jgi:ATP-dependent Clp protease ATP-binding subunit ClpA